MNCNSIILAAGKGSRMKSNIPKVLHPVGAKPMLAHLIETTKSIDCHNAIIVYGHQGDILKRTFKENTDIIWVEQKEQLGTGHAVLQVIDHLLDDDYYFILVGDAPLIKKETLLSLKSSLNTNELAVLTVKVDNPFGYGRIIRDDQQKIAKITEQKDLKDHEHEINEINTGIFIVKGSTLKLLIPKIKNNNQQQEFYLTDIIELAYQHNINTSSYLIYDTNEVMGCNDKKQLAELERYYQKQLANHLLLDGVSLSDPNRIDIRGHLKVGNNVSIDINCLFEGDVELGDNVKIEANCVIKNSKIGSDSIIKAFTHIESASIGNANELGPYARIRPDTELANHVKIGNFVETKKVKINEHSKVNHLSYVGDSNIGKYVNIGAGTITCNYDGANKHQTIIKDNVFVGSNSALVAPVTINEGATIGAGSTIRKNVEENILALSYSKTRVVSNYKRPQKK